MIGKGNSRKVYNMSKKVFVLDIPYNIDNDMFEPWTLQSEEELYTGQTLQELHNTLDNIRQNKDLKKISLKNRKSSHTDGILICIDNLLKIMDIFSDEITDIIFHGEAPVRIFVQEHFIFQTLWVEEDDDFTSLDIMQAIMNEYNIPDKTLYKKPQEIFYRKVQKAYRNDKESHTADYYPKNYKDWVYLRDALQSPIRYRSGSSKTFENMLEIDLNSAYIYALLTEKHCYSKVRKCDPLDWRDYRNRKDIGSWGTYIISYSCLEDYIRCFQTDTKDCEGNNISFEQGPNKTVRATLTNVDLDVLRELRGIVITEIRCLALYEFDMDYTPNYYRQCLLDAYQKKCKAQKGTALYKVEKLILNSGIFGNTIRKTPALVYENAKKEGKSSKECTRSAEKQLKIESSFGTLPHWGIWTISYIRKTLLELGQQLTGWKFSNTDSIYCLNTPENREIIENFNQQIQEKIRTFCETFNIDFEFLKNLGQFEIEHLKYFRSKDLSTYSKQKDDGTIITKASGRKVDKHATWQEVFGTDKYDPQGKNFTIGKLDRDGRYYEEWQSSNGFIFSKMVNKIAK